jgi:LacI family transcriptional regulator
VRFIRSQAFQGISMDDVTKRAGCSRSTLERRFRDHLGHSPMDELRKVIVRRIKQLLLETDWTLRRIASSVGIEHEEYLSVLFKRETGFSPTLYRQQHQFKDDF